MSTPKTRSKPRKPRKQKSPGRDERTNREASIEDDWGESHEYTLQTFPPDQGFNLLPEVVSVIVQPLGILIDSISGGEGKSKEASAGDDPEVGKGVISKLMDGKIQGSKIAEGINELAQQIAGAGGSDFCLELFRYTVRDGEKLNTITGFNAAFAGGNYSELFMALGFVLKENYGGVFDRLEKDIGSVLASISD